MRANQFVISVTMAFFMIVTILFLGSIQAEAAAIGTISNFEQTDDQTFTITSGNDKVKVIFNRDDMVRIWLGVGGQFTSLAGKTTAQPAEPIVVSDNFGAVDVEWSDEGTYYKMETSKFILRAYKSPMKFAMYKKDNTTVVWEEAASLSYNGTAVSQKLVRGEDEFFYGGGMQNGFFNHRDRKLTIGINYGDWGSGTVSNPSPFYISTAGYGVLRNTFQNGTYDFDSTVDLTHNENRFDAYYFYGETMKEILNGYTDLTGKPSLIPRWGMGLGDANCYNRAPGTTTDVIEQIGKAYRDHDMPGAWILPNDGYGCGYSNLGETVTELHKLGFYTGLWTQNGVDKIAQEVGVEGTRLSKLDVAWVGPGYDFALSGSKQAYQGIENNSDGRGYVWSVGGWAGTQRYSTVWSGDQSGNWEYIRFHIPSMIGAGLSGIPYSTGDIDGIFGGSAKTYVRDLQWKAFTPILMSISGWAAKDKQPWVWGEPYTSYNRDILKLRQRLTPYFYTYMNESYESGAPVVRGMIYEYPNDPNSKGTLTQYQFMSGENFLVAPVYIDSTTRNGIYLPKGKWIDYWTGEEHYGSKMLDEYNAPLDRLPLLVKAGAIIPMYPESLYDGEVPPNPITYDIYPYKTSSFTMYEDDGVTKEHRTGKFAETLITSIAPEQGTGDLIVQVGASVGDYTGKLESRTNQFMIHMPNKPTSVSVDGSSYSELANKPAWEAAASGWYYDAADKGGIVYVKTPDISTASAFELKVSGFAADTTPLIDAVQIELPEIDTDPSRIPQEDMVVSATNADPSAPAINVLDGNFETIWSTALNGSAALPQSITLNLGIKQFVSKLKYMPRQYGGTNGNITGYKVYASLDGVSYNLVSSGQWNADKKEKTATFDTVEAAFIRLEATAGEGGFAAISEINIYHDLTRPAPTPIPKSDMRASAVSFQPGAEASKAIDGDRSTVWHTKWDGSDRLPQSIILNLGSVHTISQFRYAPRTDASNGTISSYNLYVSTDGQTYTKLTSGTWSINNLKKYVVFEPVEAQFVKLEAVAAVGGFVSASELDVYDAPDVLPEMQLISENKAASADSEEPSNPASAANDGNPDTRWSAADTSSNHVWTVDLGGMYSIQSSELSFEHSDQLYKYKIEVQEAGSPNWVTVVDRTSNTEIGDVLTNQFGSRGRYVKITVTGLPTIDTKASIREVKLYGIPLNEVQKPTGVTLNHSTLTMNVLDQPVTLIATVVPENATDKTVTWSSSNINVAAVDSKGVITPKGQGTTTITVATAKNEFRATAEITVLGQNNIVEIPQSQMSAAATSSQAGVNDPGFALDGDPDTHWHTKWYNVDPLPQSISVNLGSVHNISKLGYLPRPDAGNGTITKYNIYTSLDGVTYTKVASGSWTSNKLLKEANFTPVQAAYIKLEAIEGTGEYASAAEITVFEVEHIVDEPQTQLTAPSSVLAGEAFVVRYGVTDITDPAFAQDVIITFDSSVMDFVSAESLMDGVKLIEVSTVAPGKLRLILASVGAGNEVTGDEQLIELSFKSKVLLETVTGTIAVPSAILAGETGEETEAASSSISIEVTVEEQGIPGDINGDGKVSVGDLALIAVHYGKDSTGSDWLQIKHMDLDASGTIDIADLSMVAREIIQ
ncbi:MAG: discoidin domain-containing protein [Candidatus Pristimantibacillus sp.]